jgi:hypothetical protein
MARKLKALAAAALLAAVAGCNDFLTGGELDTDPNRPSFATARQRFVGVQTAIWQFYASDLTRITTLWSQQGTGNVQQYLDYGRYDIDESVTNTFHSGLYGSGGLVDVRALQEAALAEDDSLFLGIAQVQEALLMTAGADLFGDLVYSEALKGEEVRNPPLDPQLEIYDALLVLLDDAIVNLSRTGPTNVGPGDADLAYGGEAELWTKLAHTLQARIHLRTAEVRPEAYAQALAEARLGLTRSSENFLARFGGGAGEENFWYQFTTVERAGYWIPNASFVALLEARGDPRRAQYFNAAGSALSAERVAPGFDQPLITAAENLLIWAEAAYRTGATGEAASQLNAARALAGLPAISPSGSELLRQILLEKYVATFQTSEAWNDYKRTCFPNLTPTVAGTSIPARFYYDTDEVATNSSIPPADEQPARNANDPPNATDPFGGACQGQQP